MNFWKTFGAAMLAVVIGFVALFAILLFMGIRLISSFDTQPPTVAEQSVLYIDLAEDIVDSPRMSSFTNFDVQTLTLVQPITILEALSAIEYAATDSNIRGICIRQDGEGIVSAANIEELRRALEIFKASGKFVVAYDDTYTQGEYYLASVADEVLLHPEGSLDWRGVGFNTLFMKGLIDKLNIGVEVFRPTMCRYKSAVEPYIMSKMSEANREQMLDLANSMWSTIVADVATSRGIAPERLMEVASNLEIALAEDAQRLGLVDRLAYDDELRALYVEYGVKRNKEGDINTLSLGEYITINAGQMMHLALSGDIDFASNMPQLAIIYADGEIVDGNYYMDDYVFGSALAQDIRTARLDDSVKAVVLRVNSPGGSALASDIVWREMTLLQQAKPVVVSMGDMAASGGYYISAPADYIVANRLTLTGSIGVFGVMFNIAETLRTKLGITLDSVGTSPSADGISLLRPLTEGERTVIRKGVDRVYETFVEHVAEGRNLPQSEVYTIAEGRIWSGSEAVENGLADANGGFTEAIAVAADMADLGDNFSITEYTVPLTPFEEWIESIGFIFAKSMGVDYNIYGEDIRSLLRQHPFLFTNSGIQAIVPYDVKLQL